MRGGVTERVKGFGALSAEFVLRVVFPETCAGCGVSGVWMCSACAQDIQVLDAIRAIPTQPPAHDHNLASEVCESTPVFARFVFAEPVRRSIHLLKYKGERARSEWFAGELLAVVGQVAADDAVLVPVPLTARRERARGFNQSAEIARRLSQLSGVPFGHPLTRVRETQPQVELSWLERLDNVRGAFEASERLDDRSVVLVDDVVTTGATLRECAVACYVAGARSVSAVVVASGMPRRELAGEQRVASLEASLVD